MAAQRRAGIIQLKLNGEIQDAKGNFSYNLGRPKREAIVGADDVHGFKETPQVAFIEGAITDRGNLDVAALVTIDDATVTIDLGNGKSIYLNHAWFAGDGNASTEEAEIPVRFECAGRNAGEA
ncbi:MAG TPA: phage tail tube protein [Kofleriaceae bacterium]|nr:phage tail tube protein [Kofleriaceae bacterium]